MSGSQMYIITAPLGRDPELRYTENGTAILRLALPVEVRKKGADGQWGGETFWVSAVEFGKPAESHAHILHKGSIVTVSGELDVPKLSDDGQRVYLNLSARTVTPVSNFGPASKSKAEPEQEEFGF